MWTITYWGLRDYGVAGQLGLEKTPEEYVVKMVDVFREVRRVLQDGLILKTSEEGIQEREKDSNRKWLEAEHLIIAAGVGILTAMGIYLLALRQIKNPSGSSPQNHAKKPILRPSHLRFPRSVLKPGVHGGG